MKKEHIIRAAMQIIERTAKRRGLAITNEGTGHAYDNSVWKGLLEDDSNIPHIVAKSDDYEIELRSFWGQPELSIRDGRVLLSFCYSDTEKSGDNLVSTGDYQVREFRVYSTDYKRDIRKLHKLIRDMGKLISEQEEQA